MRAVRYHGREDVRIEEIAEPEVGPDDVKIAVEYNGICGSDVHEYYAGPVATSARPHPLTGVSLPCVLGHELCGVVLEVGGRVDDLEVGIRVAVEPIETCGECARCRAGFRHLCRRLAFHGYQRGGGGLAERTVVRRDMAHPLPPQVSAREGALVEPLAVAAHAVRRTGTREGDLVLVVGGGPIGLGAALVLQATGREVIVTDPSPHRRDLLARLGLRHVVDPARTPVAQYALDLTGGLGVAGCVEAAGVPAAFADAVAAVRPDGTVVLVAHHETPLDLPSFRLIGHERRLTGSFVYERQDIEHVIGLLARRTLPVDGWVTTAAFDRVVEDALAPMAAQSTGKVLVDVAGTAAGDDQEGRGRDVA